MLFPIIRGPHERQNKARHAAYVDVATPCPRFTQVCESAGEIAEGESIRIDLPDYCIVRLDGATLPCDPVPDFFRDMVQTGGVHANQAPVGQWHNAIKTCAFSLLNFRTCDSGPAVVRQRAV